MPQPDDIDDGVELVPVPIDRTTRARLVRLAREAGAPPTDLAAALLRDMLAEDELAHGLGVPVVPSLN